MEGSEIKDKNGIRKMMKLMRCNLTRQQVEEKSGIIFNKIMTDSIYINADTVMAYVDFNNEVSTREFIQNAIKEGKKVALPLISPDRSHISARIISSLETDLVPGVFGILEPIPEKTKPVPVDNIDLIIVPGLAFDVKKYRLGYGKGYYDHFLASGLRHKCARIGVAYDFQVVEELPVESHDVPLDMIFTELRNIV